MKELYGNGFKIYLNSLADDTPKVTKFIESVLPNGWRKVDSFATSISYEFPAVKGAISKLFQTVEAEKQAVGILDYGVGQTTLEEVFIRLISEVDASSDY